jgi:hypothetical protein
VDINRIWQNIRSASEKILHYYSLKQHKSWFDEEFSELLDKRKQAKLLQPPTSLTLSSPTEVGWALMFVSRLVRRSSGA